MVAGVTVMVESPESLFSFSRARWMWMSSWSMSVAWGMGGNSSSTGVSSVDEYCESVDMSPDQSCVDPEMTDVSAGCIISMTSFHNGLLLCGGGCGGGGEMVRWVNGSTSV